MRPVALAVFALVTLTASAQDPRNERARYEKFLVPLYTDVTTGAHGAAWQTRLLMRNDGAQPLDVFPLRRDCFSTSTCFRTLRGHPSFPPSTTGISPLDLQPLRAGDSDSSSPGLLLYVERAGADDLSAQLHVADTTRRPVTIGTRVPVVRERDAFTKEVSIVGVPIAEGTRATLRIYDFDARADAAVRIRISDTSQRYENGRIIPPRGILAEDVLEFAHDPARDDCVFDFTPCPEGYNYQPGTIQIGDLLAEYPQLFQVLPPTTGVEHGIRIEITPLTPGLRYWPMVSVTENATSFVTLYVAR